MKEVPLTRGKVALVDDDVYELVMQHKWCAKFGSRNTKWYAVRWIRKHERERGIYGDRSQISMHEFIMWPPPAPGLICDHKEERGPEGGLDNQRGNLQWITQEANMFKVPGWKKRKSFPGIDF